MTGRFRVGRGRFATANSMWEAFPVEARCWRSRWICWNGGRVLKALRAQHLEFYPLGRHHPMGDDVLREVCGELDLIEVNRGAMK